MHLESVIGFVLGGFIGALTSPVFIFAILSMTEKNIRLLWLIYVPTVLATLVGAVIGPFAAMVYSVIVYVASCICVGNVVFNQAKIADPDFCEQCGYSLLGLPSRVCPECGTVGKFTEEREFNLMLKTNVGPVEDAADRKSVV